MKRFLVCAVLVACGCGQSGTSPVVEYNAAIQALETDIKLKGETEDAIKNTSDVKLKSQLKKNLEGLDRNISRLQVRVKEIGERL